MKFNVNRYTDFKAITNSFTTPKVFYTVVSGDVQALASFAATGFPYAYAPGPLQNVISEVAFLVDYPAAIKLESLSVT